MKNKFEEYLLKEYEQIAGAHFNTINTISTFFRYYTILMAVPIALGSVLIPLILDKNNTTSFLQLYSKTFLGIIFIVLSIVGIFVCSYLISLRHDALLYARTVNGIRKFFYHNSGLSQLEIQSIRVLPHSIYMPDYKDYFFEPVIYVFALIDAGYFTLGILLLNFFQSVKLDPFTLQINFLLIFDILIILLFFSLHFLLFRNGSSKREDFYLKANSIGVDIDGVLNNHREHFCEILYENRSIEIDPNDITHIPVHESGLEVTKEDEIAVFNDSRYWLYMPPTANVSSQMEKLGSSLGKTVCVFTERAWPDVKNLDKKRKKQIWLSWRIEVCKFLESMNLSTYSIVKEYFILFYNLLTNNTKIINQITRLWLQYHNIPYDKLTIENNHISRRNKKRCRFSSSKKNIQYFIEDDPEKAVRLSMLCDFVFVIKHPYNENWNFPQNVMIVKDWPELFKQLRMLSV